MPYKGGTFPNQPCRALDHGAMFDNTMLDGALSITKTTPGMTPGSQQTLPAGLYCVGGRIIEVLEDTGFTVPEAEDGKVAVLDLCVNTTKESTTAKFDQVTLECHNVPKGSVTTDGLENQVQINDPNGSNYGTFYRARIGVGSFGNIWPFSASAGHKKYTLITVDIKNGTKFYPFREKTVNPLGLVGIFPASPEGAKILNENQVYFSGVVWDAVDAEPGIKVTSEASSETNVDVILVNV